MQSGSPRGARAFITYVLEVEDIDSALDELRGKGIKLIHDTPVVGHGQCRIAFIDPSCTGNILFELAEPPRQETQ